MRRNILAGWVVAVCLVPAAAGAADPGSMIRFNEDAVVPAGRTVAEVVVLNGSAEVLGRVTGNVVVLRGNAVLRPSAAVDGDVVCIGGKLDAAPAAVVTGSKVEIGGKIGWQALPFFSIGKLLLLGFLYKVATTVVMLLLSIFLVLMWPNQVRIAAEEASLDLFKSSLVGLLALVVLVPLAIGFAITLFGLPISLAIVFFLTVASWFGVATVAFLVGHKFWPGFSPLVAVIAGLLILKLVHFVPFIGGMLYFIAVLPGLGAILLTRFGTNRPWLDSTQAAPPRAKRARR
jgi:hypothetical protein